MRGELLARKKVLLPVWDKKGGDLCYALPGDNIVFCTLYPDDVIHQRRRHPGKSDTRISVDNRRLRTVIHRCITVRKRLSLRCAENRR